jgi:hypothetical protein
MRKVATSVSGLFFRLFAGIALLAIAFWPEYGGAYYIAKNFADAPTAFVITIAIWFSLLALNMPLSLNWFRRITTGSILAIFGAGLFTMYTKGLLDLSELNSWIITVIVLLGLLMGWWTVATRLWVWYRATRAVDDTGDYESN